MCHGRTVKQRQAQEQDVALAAVLGSGLQQSTETWIEKLSGAF